MRLRLVKLQAEDGQARKIRAEKLGKNWEDLDGILHHQGLLYVSEIIRTELISRHHDDPLADYFSIKKTQELIARKYYWETLHHDIEVYVRGCDVCLTSKPVKHKPYRSLQQLPVLNHHLKDLSIDFVMGLLQSTNWRDNGYDSILVIVNQLTKMVYYKPVQIIITILALAKVILNVIV